ncbi:MAG: thioredoxin-disulfide reductase [Treponema sp.]|nr:thioredoxin-disulfide reductase [Treponema sp.]
MENSETNEYDLIILGAGPAGLSAAQYSARANLKTLVLDQGLGGGQAANIFNLENYPGVFPPVQGWQWIATMKNQAESFGAQIKQAAVSSIDKIEGHFVVKTNNTQYTSLALVAATGAKHRTLGAEGEKEFSGRGVSYCATCDGPFFKNKDVVVVGGGDSACDEAVYLATLCSHVTVIHRKSQFRAQKAVAQRVLSNPKISVRFNSSVTRFIGDKTLSSVELTDTVSGEKSTLETSGAFIFVGMIPQTSLFSSLKTDEAGYIITGEDMETSIPGLFAAGDVRSKTFRQIVTACSDGAIASHSAQNYIRLLKNEEYK